MEADFAGDRTILFEFGVAITAGVVHLVTSLPGEVNAVAAEMAVEPALDGPEGELAAGDDYHFKGLRKMFLYARADTIYAGTNQIQRNIIAERALGLPREPRVS